MPPHSSPSRYLRVLFLLCLFCLPARADDSALERVGGAVAPMRSHPSVRMVSEEVHLRLPQCEVEARFVFRNEGRPCTVEIGFPEEGKKMPLQPPTYLRRFRSYVDGRPIRVTRRVAQKPTDDTNGEYQYWWVKRVRFGRGQTRVVVNRYRGGELYTTYGIRGIKYILTTGANWKGPIGYARLVCDFSGLKEKGYVQATPGAWRRAGNRLTWEARNFEPKENVEIRWSDGFFNIQVNGRQVQTNDNEPEAPIWLLDLGAALPRRQGPEVWVPVRAAAKWLGAQLDETAPGRFRLQRGGQWAEVRRGSRWVRSSSGAHRMAAPAFMEQDTHLVALAPLVRALGGTSRWGRGGRYVVWLKSPAGL